MFLCAVRYLRCNLLRIFRKLLQSNIASSTRREKVELNDPNQVAAAQHDTREGAQEVNHTPYRADKMLVLTTHAHVVAVRNSRIAMVAIFVNNLIKTFGDKTAVSIPEFCFPSNEIIGLVGNNGAG